MAQQQMLAVMQESGVGFGTSGARGLVSAMTDEVCAAYTHAFIQAMQGRFTFTTIAIATDLRPSSPQIALACSRMAQQLGLKVVFCGAIPTPALALYAQTQQIPGIMVTGSHIPFDRNGLKFYRPDGEISKADEAAMLASEISPLNPSTAALPPEDLSAKHAYMQRYLDLLGEGGLNGLTVALYQHSSVGRDLMQQLFEALGAKVLPLERSDTFVPIDTEAVSAEDMAKGLRWAAEYGVDAIISTDGDGDRPLISDERGHWLRGDIVGLLTARSLKIKHLAVPVSCNTAIEVSGFFNQVVRTRIGSPYVIAGMEEMQAQGLASIAGFEANGGFLLGSTVPDYPALSALPTRDAVLPVVCLLKEVKLQGKPLSKMVSELPARFTASDRLQNFATEKSKQLIAAWSKVPDNVKEVLQLDETPEHIDMTDGLRMHFPSGNIVHLRPSGNAPELRCYVETSTEEHSAALVSKVLARVATAG